MIEPTIDTYLSKTHEIRAIQWTGENLKQVQELYPHLGEEYMRDRGAQPGDYVVVPRPGRVDFVNHFLFHARYEIKTADATEGLLAEAEAEGHLAVWTARARTYSQALALMAKESKLDANTFVFKALELMVEETPGETGEERLQA